VAYANLPQPTTDLERARADLDESGYCLLADAMDATCRQALLTRLKQQAEAEKQLGLAFEDGGPTQQWGGFRDADGGIRAAAFRAENGGINQRVWMLPNKGRVFLDLLIHARVNELVSYVLGDEFLLSSYTANIAKPGGVKMNLHTDQWWMPEPVRRERRGLPVGSMTRTCFDSDADNDHHMIAPAACCNVIWMLSDFSASNGATRVVPGSHRSGRHPDPEHDKDVATVGAVAPAGSALITDGRLWHGTGANIGNQPRYALLTTYCGPQFRPQENFTVGLSDTVMRDAPPQLLALFGFKVWHAYGRTGHPTVDYIERHELLPGELNP
jgi:ectoine hydroxylase-related dioxygenase (phytanoyl-CoA dioxygenase family)